MMNRDKHDRANQRGIGLDESAGLRTLASWGTRYLHEHGVPNAHNNAEWILCDAMKCNRVDIYLDAFRALDPDLCDTYLLNIRRRARREPLQYILGTTEFMSLPFCTPPGVFVPRPDTELLVETAESRLRSMPLAPRQNVLDLCCGSGAIAISLAARIPNLEAWALDISVKAAHVTAMNAEINCVEGRVHAYEGDASGFLDPDVALCAGTPDPRPDYFAAILCNPPYIESDDVAELPPEVRDHEPGAALDGGPDGLHFYVEITPKLPPWLEPGGFAAFEIGETQGAAVSAIMENAGFVDVAVTPDHAGRDRVVLGVKPAATEDPL
jgi:release factor glutamine methyltransferase